MLSLLTSERNLVSGVHGERTRLRRTSGYSVGGMSLLMDRCNLSRSLFSVSGHKDEGAMIE